MRQHLLVAGMTALWLGLALPVFAQPPQGPPPGGPPAGGPPSNWWEHSPLAEPVVPSNLRVHVEGTASVMSAAGNTDGYAFDGHAGFVLRKRRITNRFDADLSRHDLSYGAGGGSAAFTMRTIRDQFELAASKMATVVAGVEDHRNTLMFIDKRLTFYTGVGLRLKEDPRQSFDVIGGVGHVAFTFDREAVARVAPLALAAVPTTSPTSMATLINETWRITFPNKMMLMEDASYRDYFNDDLGHLWTISVMVNMPVDRHLSIVPSYTLKEEKSIYTEALRVRPQDRTLTFGVRVSF